MKNVVPVNVPVLGGASPLAASVPPTGLISISTQYASPSLADLSNPSLLPQNHLVYKGLQGLTWTNFPFKMGCWALLRGAVD